MFSKKDVKHPPLRRILTLLGNVHIVTYQVLKL